MKIRYIDGNRFSRAIVAGASKLFVRQDFLNKINVFPIPDSDTGTNMASTMRAIVESISGFHSISISSLSTTVADSAQYYEQQIKKEFGIEEVPILPVSPVLGAHAGIGAAAIGITWGEG